MNLDEILIRPPTPDDARAMIAYMERLTSEPDNNIMFDPGQFNYTEERERAWIANHADSDKSIFLLAQHDGRVIAITELARLSAPTQSHVAGLGISIDRDYRRLGLGTRLMGRLLDWARAHAIKRVELKVFARNHPAIALYAKFGFVEEGRHRMIARKQGQFLDDLTMALLLD